MGKQKAASAHMKCARLQLFGFFRFVDAKRCGTIRDDRKSTTVYDRTPWHAVAPQCIRPYTTVYHRIRNVPKQRQKQKRKQKQRRRIEERRTASVGKGLTSGIAGKRGNKQSRSVLVPAQTRVCVFRLCCRFADKRSHRTAAACSRVRPAHRMENVTGAMEHTLRPPASGAPRNE